METLHEKKAGKQASTEKSIDQRFQQEIRNCEKLAESQLNVKSPANLASGKETPMPRCSPGRSSDLGWSASPCLATARLAMPHQAVPYLTSPRNALPGRPRVLFSTPCIHADHESISEITTGGCRHDTVSYTHLTLPTKRIV